MEASKGESLMKAMLNELLPDQQYADNLRPAWLATVAGGCLELDRYYPLLRLAFEFQGEQHYYRVSAFQGSRGEFLAQKERDKQKMALCRQHGVKLCRLNKALLSTTHLRHRLRQMLSPHKLASFSLRWEVGKLMELDACAAEYRGNQQKVSASQWLKQHDESREGVPRRLPNPNWRCPKCGWQTRRKGNIKVLYCERCARSEIATRMDKIKFSSPAGQNVNR